MVSVLKRLLVLVAVPLLLAGCAETRQVMRADPLAGPAPVFPAAPETPRFRYAGQLLGEENFVDEDGGRKHTAVKLLRWLVGLAGGQDKVTLMRPQSGVVDEQGRVYVTDTAAHAVFVFDRAAGKLLVWEEAIGRRRFATPVGIALGPAGQVLVADADLGLVLRLDRDGKPLGAFGKDVLARPTGIARDPVRGRIYVSDTHAHDVKVFSDDGTLVGTLGRRGEDAGELNFPTHLAFGGDRLYVADTMNARVAVFGVDGKPAGSIGQRGTYIGNLARPKGVAVGPGGLLYVVESYHDHLLVFDLQGRFLMPIGGTGKETGQFYLPAGAFTDAAGRVYVADMFNGRVVIFEPLAAP